jgi:hypothetical protein
VFVAGLALTVGAMIGVLAVGGYSAFAASNLFSTTDNNPNVQGHTPDGRSYGWMPGPAATSDAPDLVAVVGDDGVSGYLDYNQLVASPIVTPEQALGLQKAATHGRELPVFAKDGKTVVDQFTTQSGGTATQTP